MLIVNFNRGNDVARAVRSAWQYDYGQKLYIHGLDLPEVVEIGFSLTESGGMDNPRFGVTKDGVTEVIIPDAMMAGEDTEYDYKIYAFIFVEDGNQESGRTVKRADISVKSRPKRWMDDETGDNFSEIVKAVRDLVEEYKKSGVSDEQVRAALNDYLADHPIDTLTEDEVRAIVNAMLGDITQTHFEKVDVLPDDGKENIIYLVPTENTEEQNIYDEYIFLNGIPELIGTTKINLEGYATKEEFRKLSETIADLKKELEELRTLIENGDIDSAVALLDSAILDLSTLA